MSEGEHIPYPRIEAAIRARHLSFLLRHIESLGLREEIELCRLIAEQRPEQLEAASVRWIILIVRAFDRLLLAPERSVGELKALCAARGAA
jgi:hypothetical protein